MAFLLHGIQGPSVICLMLFNPDGSMYIRNALEGSLKDRWDITIICYIFELLIIKWIDTSISTCLYIWCGWIFQNVIWLDNLTR